MKISKCDIPGKLDVQHVTRGSRTAAAVCCWPPTITIMNRFLNVDYKICLNGCQNRVYISFYFSEPSGLKKKKTPKDFNISWSVGFQIRQTWRTNPPHSQMAPDGQIKQPTGTAGSYLLTECCWWQSYAFFTQLVRVISTSLTQRRTTLCTYVLRNKNTHTYIYARTW